MPLPKQAKRKVTFCFKAPEAQSVALVADFSEWEQSPIPMKKQKDGGWKAAVSLATGTYQYRFLVDGQWCDDPECTTRMPNPFGAENCVRVVE
jgi:1,4-alpha-glucan branching enzyme